MIFHPVAEHSSHVQGKLSFGTDEIDFPQQVVRLYQFIDMWTDLISHIRQDPDDLPFLCIVEFPDLVIHLKQLHRLHKYRLSGRRLIMYHPLDLAFVSAPERNYQSSLTQRHLRIIIRPAIFFYIGKDLVHPLFHTPMKPEDCATDPC